MTPSVYLSSAAQRDITRIVAWYEDQRSGLGREWFTAFDEALAEAARNPLSCAPLGDALRKTRLRRFPYVAVFLVIPEQLRVLAVLGDGQDWDAILRIRSM